MTDFNGIMEARGVTLTVTPIRQREDDGWNDNHDHMRTHYAFAIENKTGRLIGEYSKGCYDLIKAVKTGKVKTFQMRLTFDKQTIINLLEGKRKLRDPKNEKWADFMFQAASKVKPTALDILMSCFMDAQGSDIEFAEWATEYGYSDDSMRAKKTWETCNNTRRKLKNIFGDDYDAMLGLASEY
jgi:hypothetical protein